MAHPNHPLPDPRRLPPEDVTRQTQGWADWAEALSSGNPFSIAKAALESLRGIQQDQRTQLELQRQVWEHMRNPPRINPSWIARGFRYSPDEGVRKIDFGASSAHTHIYIQTLKTTDMDGQFYISLTRTMGIDPVVGRPHVEDFEFAGSVGSKSERLHLPLGSQNLWYWANMAHDGIMLLATSKDALPGG